MQAEFTPQYWKRHAHLASRSCSHAIYSTFEHYFVSDNRVFLRLRNGIPSDYLIPFLFPISPGTEFRTVVSLSNGRRVSISRAKSAKWISIRPSTKSIPLAAPIPFFPAGFFPRFYLAPLHLTKSSPRASLVAAIKFAWKLFRVESDRTWTLSLMHSGIDIIP